MPDEPYHLNATVTPVYAANSKVNWTSSDSSVVTVDQDGKLKALKVGTAVITATEQMKSRTASCTVMVTDSDFILPADLTEIEEAAFEGTDAKVVYVPDNCIRIGAYTFRDSSIVKIRIPAGCELGDEVFAGCGNVTILGTAGSDAELYAQDHGLGFVAVN